MILSKAMLSVVTEKETKLQIWTYPGEYSRDLVTQLSAGDLSPISHSHEYIALEISLASTSIELKNMEDLDKDTWNQ